VQARCLDLLRRIREGDLRSFSERAASGKGSPGVLQKRNESLGIDNNVLRARVDRHISRGDGDA
jgi:hypothetical protein